MILHLNGTEEIKVINKDNGFQDITINGLNYQQSDGTIRKVNVILPNVKINSDIKDILVYVDEVDKSLWTLELEE